LEPAIKKRQSKKSDGALAEKIASIFLLTVAQIIKDTTVMFYIDINVLY
jgi:hypothetical protein